MLVNLKGLTKPFAVFSRDCYGNETEKSQTDKS